MPTTSTPVPSPGHPEGGMFVSVTEAMAQGRGVFFGTRWGAPAFEDAIEVSVPVGEVCLFCTEVVEEGDSGTFTSYMDASSGSAVRAVHIECWLRSILGCRSHLEHRCSCYGGSDHEGYTREAARAVMDYLLATHLRDPLSPVF